jgi:predicted PurR-regulated permease PerM
MPIEKKTLEVSWTSLWRIFFFGMFVIVFFLGRRVLLGLFLAIVISSGLEFMVNFLEKRGLPRTLGVIVVFLVCVFIVTITIYSVVPLILVDASTITSGLTKLVQSSLLAPLVSANATQTLNTFISNFSTQFLSNGSSPLSAFSNIVGGIVLTLSIFITSFYLSLSRDGVERFIRAMVPADYEETTLRIYARSRRRIGVWFRTQILLSVIMAFLVIVTLLILKVHYAFFLGILAGLFELVPFVGPILSGSVAVLSALTTSPTLAIYTLIAFLILHQIENHVLVPLLVGHSVGMHPVIVLVALLIGIEVGGLLGILISVPMAVVFQEIIEDWGTRKKPREVAII